MIVTGDVGTNIEIELNEDVSSALSATIIYKKPNREVGNWAGTIDGTNKITYTTQEGDVDVSGRWRLQVFVDLGVWSGCSLPVIMDVADKLTQPE